MDILKFIPVRQVIDQAIRKPGYLLINHPLKNYVEYVSCVYTASVKIIKDLDWVLHYKSISKDSLMHQVDLAHDELKELRFYATYTDLQTTNSERRPYAKRLKILADGDSLELPEYIPHLVEQLSSKEQKVVSRQRDAAMLDALGYNPTDLYTFYLYATIHPDDPTFLYFGTVSESSYKNEKSYFISLEKYWEDSKREGYQNTGIKKIFQYATRDWFDRLENVPLGKITVPHKEDRLPFIGKLIDLAIEENYDPINQKTNRHDRPRVKSVAMEGPIIDILLWGDLPCHLFKLF